MLSGDKAIWNVHEKFNFIRDISDIASQPTKPSTIVWTNLGKSSGSGAGGSACQFQEHRSYTMFLKHWQSICERYLHQGVLVEEIQGKEKKKASSSYDDAVFFWNNPAVIVFQALGAFSLPLVNLTWVWYVYKVFFACLLWSGQERGTCCPSWQMLVWIVSLSLAPPHWGKY